MKKIISKIIVPFIILISIVFATIINNNRSDAATSGAYTTDYEIVFTEDLFVAEDYSNVITEATPGATFYATIFVKNVDIIGAITANWKWDTSTVTSASLITGAGQSGDNTTLMSEGVDMYASSGYTAGMAMFMNMSPDVTSKGRTPNSNYIEGTATSTLYTKQLTGSVVVDAGKGKFAVGLSAANDVTPGSYVLAKLKFTLASTASTFAFEMEFFNMHEGGANGSTYTRVAHPQYMIDAYLGGAVASSSTDLTKFDFKGNNDSAKSTGTGTNDSSGHTGSWTFDSIQATSTTVDLDLSVDNGKGSITAVSWKNNNSGASGSATPGNTITGIPVANRGDTVTVTVEVLAQDLTTTGTHTITISRLKYSNSSIDNIEFAGHTTSFTPIVSTSSTSYATNLAVNGVHSNPTKGTNYYVYVSDKESQLDVSTVLPSGYESKLKVNGTVYSSGATVPVTVVNNATITIEVTAEDGSTSTYNYVIKTISSNTKLSSALVLTASGTSIASATYDDASNKWKATIDYSNSSAVKYETIEFKFTPDKSGNTLYYNGTSTNPVSVITSGSATATVNINDNISNRFAATTVSVYVKVVDKDTGDSDIWEIEVTRSAAESIATYSSVTVSATSGGSDAGGTWSDGKNDRSIFTTSTTSAAAIPYGSTLAYVSVVAESSKAKVSINSQTASKASQSNIAVNPTLSPISVIITAEDGTSNIYFVNIETAAPSNDITLKATTGVQVGKTSSNIANATENSTYVWSYDNVSVFTYDINNCYIKINTTNAYATWSFKDGMPAPSGYSYSYNSTAVYKTGEGASFTYDVSGRGLGGTFPIVIVVTAQDGVTQKEYTLNLKRGECDTNGKIKDDSTGGILIYQAGKSTAEAYTLDPYTYVVGEDNEVSGTLTNKLPFTCNNIDINATRETTSVLLYTITTTYTTFTSKTGTNNLTALSGTKAQNLVIGDSTYKNEIHFTIIIRLETQSPSTTMTYIITGIREAAETNSNANIRIDNVTDSVLNLAYSQTGPAANVYTLTVTDKLAYSVNQLKVIVSVEGEFATATVDGQAYDKSKGHIHSIPSSINGSSGAYIDGKNTITVKVIAQNGDYTQFNIIYTRKAPDTNNKVNQVDIFAYDLDKVANYVTLSTTTYVVTSNTTTIDFTVPYLTQNTKQRLINLDINVKNVPTLAKIYYQSETSVWASETDTKHMSLGSASDCTSKVFTTKFRIVSEAGDTHTYIINVTTTEADNDNSITISAVTKMISGSEQNNGGKGKSGVHYYYQYTASVATGIKFTITCSPKAILKFSTDGSTWSDWDSVSNKVYTAASALSYTTYYVMCYSEAQQYQKAPGQQYFLEIILTDERNSDATLKTFNVSYNSTQLVNDITISTFTPDSQNPAVTLVYKVPFAYESVTVMALTTDPKATVYKDKLKNAAQFTIDLKTITPGASTSQTYYYWVQAENEDWSTDASGTSMAYAIKIIREEGSSLAGISDLKVNGSLVPTEIDGSSAVFTTYSSTTSHTYVINLGHGGYLNSVTPTVTRGINAKMGNSVSGITGGLTNTNRETVTWSVVSENGKTTVSYTLYVYAADTNYDVSDVRLLDSVQTGVTGTTGSYSYLTPVYANDNDSNRLYDYSKISSTVYDVTTTDGAMVAYSLNSILFDVMVSPYAWVLYNTDVVTTSNKTQGQYQLLQNLSALKAGNKMTFKFYVYSEYDVASGAKTPRHEFIFNITRVPADTENRFATFDAMIGGVPIKAEDITFDPDSNAIVVQNVSDYSTSTSFEFSVTKMSAKSTHMLVNTSTSLTDTVSLSFSGGTATYGISCTSEAGVKNTYTITIHSGPANLDKNVDLGLVEFTGSDSPATVYYSATPAATNTEATATVVKVPTTETRVTITANLPTGSQAGGLSINYKGPTNSSYVRGGSTLYTLTVTNSDTGVNKYLVKIIVTAQNPSYTGEYYYLIEVEQAKNINTLDAIVIDGNPYVPDSQGKVYVELPNKYLTTGTSFGVNCDSSCSVEINPDFATFAFNTGDLYKGMLNNLTTGMNKVIVKVKPQLHSGTTKTYTANIWIDELNEFDGLEVQDYLTFDTNNTFSPAFNGSNYGPYGATVEYTEDYAYVWFSIPATIDAANLRIYYMIDSDTSQYSFNSSNRSNPISLKTGVTTVKVYVAQNVNTLLFMNTPTPVRTYEINITKKAASSVAILKTINAAGVEVPNFDSNDSSVVYPVILPRTTSYCDLDNITIEGVSYTISYADGSTLVDSGTGLYRASLIQGGVKYINVTVTAEDKSTNTYKFALVACDQNSNLDNLELLEKDKATTLVDLNGDSLSYDKDVLAYNNLTDGTSAPYEVAYATEYAYLKIEKPKYATAIVIVNGTQFKYNEVSTTIYVLVHLEKIGANTNDISIQIQSEYFVAYDSSDATKASSVYTISITRNNLDNDARVESAVFKIDGVEKEFDDGITWDKDNEGMYYISDIGSASIIDISATPFLKTAKILSGVGSIDLTTGSNASSYNFMVTIVCQAEDGTQKEYKISISRGPQSKSDDNTCLGIDLYDNSNKYYIATKTAVTSEMNWTSSNTGVYKVTLPYGLTSYTMFVYTNAGTAAKPHITSDSTGSVVDNQVQTLQIPLTKEMYLAGQVINHVVYVMSESNIQGTKYTIEVTLTPPSSESNLAALWVDDQNILADLTPNESGVYVLQRDNLITEATISYKFKDPTETIAPGSDIGLQVLEEGPNYFKVTVVAQDGITKTVYNIQINRAYSLPKLLTLGVNGERLLDFDTLDVTKFDPETLSYKVKIIFAHETADIFATSAEPSDIITGTGLYPMVVGHNYKSVTITSVHNVSTVYDLDIIRLPSETTNADLALCTIDQLDISKKNIGPLADNEAGAIFNDDFDPLLINYGEYVVDNKITHLDVNATAYNSIGGYLDDGTKYDAAKVAVYGNQNLVVGKNNVVILVTAADGITTKAYVVTVIREPLKFTVDEEKVEEDGYTIEQLAQNQEYKLSIGKDKTSDVDFESYIKDLNPGKQVLEIEVLSDISMNPDEVLVKVTTDNDEIQIVKFYIESEGNGSGISVSDLIPLFIILGIVLIVLICILIAVNRDKYGRVVRKADREEDGDDDDDDGSIDELLM